MTYQDIEPTPKQTEFIQAALSNKFNYLLYGGAIRGGKTWMLLMLIFLLCRIYPRSRWAIVRKDLATLKQTTVPSFEKIKPDFVGNLNRSTWTAKCANGSEIIFWGEQIHRDPDLNRFKGLEVNGFVLEECNELQEQTFFKAIERAGAWIIPGMEKQPHPVVLMSCNPALGWVKNRFYNPWKKGHLEAPYYYLPAKATDNPYIPGAVRESWKNLPEAEYRRFVEGDWDVADDPSQLIKFEWLHNAKHNVEPAGGRQSMGLDVARFGDDETTLAYYRGNCLYEIEPIKNARTNQVAQYAIRQMQERGIGADRTGVDVVGIGAGVVDYMVEQGYNVKEIISGASPVEMDDTSYQFKDLRSQMWWYYRDQLSKAQLSIKVNSPKLDDDLLAVHYKMHSDRSIKVESKDDIKKRIGRSTDYGDSAIYGRFAPYVPATRANPVIVFG